ncbi:SDR family NAD(P)-dependent oxidoreductase [Actinomycetospora endophytica]|uniref:SDR family NAD(P)-dependent oxidoreductase n=1 Tax=Actinomycetospora endophytica TaxID=2291215 RepID=A0ABS8PH56_9PSEU|nr:SDR family NAD(P)-dependent oxidoreductase [Actinomycetospora endophytica]MCD2197594.1 SDR family NAD(P)-dependent oxidoreductase [Actinomycetospora endophytica]
MSTAFVTGADGGIGRAIVADLAARGYAVAAVDRTAPVVEHERVLGLAADVADPAAVEAAVEHAENALGPVTALVCGAGVLRTGPVLETSDDDWRACLDVNATGVFTACRAVGRRMVARGGGSVVTVASNAAGVPRAHMASYAASKAAATAFTRSFGLEVAAHGVRANVVCPGSTDTPMLRSMWPDPDDDRSLADVVAGSPELYKVGIPLGRVGEPGDIAATVAFLLSGAARHVTLQTLYVDGGASLGP